MTEREPLMDLRGKVALVTGSSAGLGHEIACALGLAGARVALNYAHDAVRAKDAMSRYLETGATGTLFQADVTDEAAIDGLVKAVTRELGAIDILVVNATPSQPQRTLEGYQWDEVQAMLDAFLADGGSFEETADVTDEEAGIARDDLVNLSACTNPCLSTPQPSPGPDPSPGIRRRQQRGGSAGGGAARARPGS